MIIERRKSTIRLSLAIAATNTVAATMLPTNTTDKRASLDAPDEEAETADLQLMDQQLQEAVHRAYTGDEDEAEEGVANADAEIDADGENDESEPVGAVKLPDGSGLSDPEDVDYVPADEEAADNPAEDKAMSTSAGDAEEWEAESNNHEDGDNISDGNCMLVMDFFFFFFFFHCIIGRVLMRKYCRFCNQDEEHDPGEEFEEYLTCSACGRHCKWDLANFIRC